MADGDNYYKFFETAIFKYFVQILSGYQMVALLLIPHPGAVSAFLNNQLSFFFKLNSSL
jgi:hypothetical protein